MDELASSFEIMGCPCFAFVNELEVKNHLKRIVNSGRGGYTVAINAEKIVRRSSDLALDVVLQGAVLPVADGAGAVLALKWLHGKRSIKVDMPRCAFEAANECGWRVFILGSEEQVNAVAAERVRSIYPFIKLVGRLNGYASYDEILLALRNAQPQLVFIALGSPKQELFAEKLSRILNGVMFVGCGGALDILAGKVLRAPKFCIDNNLEWAYRLYKQPSRWRRQLVLPVFFCRLVKQSALVRMRQF